MTQDAPLVNLKRYTLVYVGTILGLVVLSFVLSLLAGISLPAGLSTILPAMAGAMVEESASLGRGTLAHQSGHFSECLDHGLRDDGAKRPGGVLQRSGYGGAGVFGPYRDHVFDQQIFPNLRL